MEIAKNNCGYIPLAGDFSRIPAKGPWPHLSIFHAVHWSHVSYILHASCITPSAMDDSSSHSSPESGLQCHRSIPTCAY